MRIKTDIGVMFIFMLIQSNIGNFFAMRTF